MSLEKIDKFFFFLKYELVCVYCRDKQYAIIPYDNVNGRMFKFVFISCYKWEGSPQDPLINVVRIIYTRIYPSLCEGLIWICYMNAKYPSCLGAWQRLESMLKFQ